MRDKTQLWHERVFDVLEFWVAAEGLSPVVTWLLVCFVLLVFVALGILVWWEGPGIVTYIFEAIIALFSAPLVVPLILIPIRGFLTVAQTALVREKLFVVGAILFLMTRVLSVLYFAFL